jgi:O-succinylbenzoate synthase
MFRIERITLREIRLALKEPFRISSGVVSERRICLLEITNADGTVSWSECVAGELPNYSPETIDTAWMAIREWLAPRVLDRLFDSPTQVLPALDKDVRGHNMAKAAIEMGCWDLAARLDNMSLSRALGGTRDRVATGISIGIQANAAALVQRATAALDAGYRKIKLKIQPGADVEYVDAVRQALGPSVHLMADANSAYTLADVDHLAASRSLQPHHDRAAARPRGSPSARQAAGADVNAHLSRRVDHRRDHAEDMIALKAGRIINIKPGRVGGYRQSKAIHDLCQRNDIPVWCGGMLESGVGRAYNVALASLPNFKLPGDLSPSARYWERDIVDPEWTMDDEGMVHVPLDRPGIGVDIDRDRIEELTVRREVLEPDGATLQSR